MVGFSDGFGYSDTHCDIGKIYHGLDREMEGKAQMMRSLLSLLLVACSASFVEAQIAGALPSYNDGKQNVERTQQYFPEGDDAQQ